MITVYGSGVPLHPNVEQRSQQRLTQLAESNRIARQDRSWQPGRFFNTTLCPVNTTVLANGTPCAFQIPVANTYGNSGRSILYGPSTKNWDLGLQRKFKIYENMAISLRLDAFNAFNTPNFRHPERRTRFVVCRPDYGNDQRQP